MIYFDQETRAFSVVEDRNFAKMPGYIASAGIGMAASGVYGKYKHEKAKRAFMEQGMDERDADKEASRKVGSVGKHIRRGVGLGLGARFVGGRARTIGKSIGPIKLPDSIKKFFKPKK